LINFQLLLTRKRRYDHYDALTKQRRISYKNYSTVTKQIVTWWHFELQTIIYVLSSSCLHSVWKVYKLLLCKTSCGEV